MRQILVAAALLGLSAVLCGCGANGAATTSPPAPIMPPYTPPVGNYPGETFTGKVLAGTTPVIGSTVQLYAAGASGNGSAPTQLLSTGLTTDANGAFNVATAYTCPYNTSVLYIVASGGHAGANGPTSAGTVLMTSPGACDTISGNPLYVLDEVTTVASAYAFAQFLKPGAQLGATSTNSSGITLAAGTLGNLVNLSTGVAPGAAFPATGTVPAARLNTLANAVNACILSSTACGNLYADTTVSGAVPSNTLDALVNIAQHPATNVAPIYALGGASSAYSPALTATPKDWTLFVTYAGGGMNAPSALSIDSTGRVWVASYFSTASLFSNTGVPVLATGVTGDNLYESYGGAVDANDNFWIVNEESSGAINSGDGDVTVLNSAGQDISGTSGYTAGGVYFPYGIAIDSTNVAWVADYTPHVTLLNSSGTSVSGAAGYASGDLNFPVAVAVDSNRNGWLANSSSNYVTKVSADGSSFTNYACCDGASDVAIDSANNVWVSNFYGSSVSLISSAGKVLSGGGYTGGGLDQPEGLAVDGSGNAWAVSYRTPSAVGDTLVEFAGATTANPGAVLSPATGYGTDAGMAEAYGAAIDAAGNLWITSFASNTLTQFVGLAAPVKTPLLGPVRVP